MEKVKQQQRQQTTGMGYVPPKRKATALPPQPVIPPCDENAPIPKGQTCQEVQTETAKGYVYCGDPAVAIVRHDKDRRSYYMCGPCADHNVSNRGGKYIVRPKRQPSATLSQRSFPLPDGKKQSYMQYADPPALPSAAGLRFDELPMTSTFSRRDMDEAIRLMTEDVEYADQEAVVAAERKKGKAALEAIGRKYVVPGMRHGMLEVRLYTEQRETLDKGLFVELGGDIDVLRQSYRKGKEFVKVVVKDTSRAKRSGDSEE